jgi:uncharacterized repeat protein (TIGR02543 family)
MGRLPLYAGAKATKPTDPTRTNHVFGGWFTDNTTFANEWNFEVHTVTENVTLFAKWIAQYRVTFNSTGGSPTPQAQTIVDGDKATRPSDPTRASHVFDGWFTDNNTFANEWDFDANTVTENVTLFAKWIRQYTVTFNSDGGSAVDPQTVVDGEKATNPANPTKAIPAGLYMGTLPGAHTFDGWFAIGSTTAFDFNTPITNNITLTARWSIAGGGTRITAVEANDIATSFLHINANPGTYTLLIDRDISSATQTLSSARHLTILGTGGERKITCIISATFLFNINNANASLTLGENITLIGPHLFNCLSVQAGSLIMKAGSKITGTSWESRGVTVTGINSSFTMEGGEISGHRGGGGTSIGTGVFISNNATFVMNGGMITNNSNHITSSDVFIDHNAGTFTLSGNAEIGVLTLNKENNGANASVAIGAEGFTGTVTLNLRVLSGDVVAQWTQEVSVPTIIKNVTNTNVLSRFTLGQFVNTQQPISTNYRLNLIGNEARLVWRW